MRPARKGPENRLAPGRRARRRPGASMRPARKGPENHALDWISEHVSSASMRPARKGPENPCVPAGSGMARACFNEAGPQGAGKPRRRRETTPAARPASMRPARKGPENRAPAGSAAGTSPRFNEAGPQGAGKPPAALRRRRPDGAGFNEAGPQGAGKPWSIWRRWPNAVIASMRPARKGPENRLGAIANAKCEAMLQ